MPMSGLPLTKLFAAGFVLLMLSQASCGRWWRSGSGSGGASDDTIQSTTTVRRGKPVATYVENGPLAGTSITAPADALPAGTVIELHSDSTVVAPEGYLAATPPFELRILDGDGNPIVVPDGQLQVSVPRDLSALASAVENLSLGEGETASVTRSLIKSVPVVTCPSSFDREAFGLIGVPIVKKAMTDKEKEVAKSDGARTGLKGIKEAAASGQLVVKSGLPQKDSVTAVDEKDFSTATPQGVASIAKVNIPPKRAPKTRSEEEEEQRQQKLDENKRQREEKKRLLQLETAASGKFLEVYRAGKIVRSCFDQDFPIDQDCGGFTALELSFLEPRKCILNYKAMAKFYKEGLSSKFIRQNVAQCSRTHANNYSDRQKKWAYETACGGNWTAGVDDPARHALGLYCNKTHNANVYETATVAALTLTDDDVEEQYTAWLEEPTEVGVLCEQTNAQIEAYATATSVDADEEDLASYTIGGSVSGLSGAVTLQLNKSESLTINQDGAFAFTGAIKVLSTYEVTVETQPTGQNCDVSGGAGTLDSEKISTVEVKCAATAAADQAPTVGSSITATVSGLKSMTVTWGAASDDQTAAGNLQYKLVSASTTAAIDTVEEAEAVTGAGLRMDWTAGTTSKVVTGLNLSTSYAFAVLVRDAANQSALYVPVAATSYQHTSPVAAAQYRDVLAVGERFTCALTSDGGAKCLGLNTSGQLGDGTTTNRTSLVATTADALRVYAGSDHGCVIDSSGGAKCWGLNSTGQLGDGTTTNRLSPVSVAGLTSVKQMALGDQHSCALTTGGDVYCWGANASGQVGDGSTTTRSSPTQVSGLSGVVTIDSQHNHTCAVLTDKSVKCWGANADGQLGNGSTTASSTAVAATSVTDVAQVSTGLAHTCALKTDGSALCWGKNSQAQLGAGSSGAAVTSAQAVSVVTSGIHRIEAAGDRTCFALSAGGVSCVGFGGQGQLGNGASSNSNTAVSVSGVSALTVVGLKGAQDHSCAAMNDDTIRCWGYNSNGQIGDGTTADKNAPVQLLGL